MLVDMFRKIEARGVISTANMIPFVGHNSNKGKIMSKKTYKHLTHFIKCAASSFNWGDLIILRPKP